MKFGTTYLLLGAACLPALTVAQAADLPTKAKSDEYVKVCSAFGAGYYYIPGTDTCIKIGGYARADFYANMAGTFNPPISNLSGTLYNAPGAGISGFPLMTQDSPDYLTRARGLLSFDTRTQTDYGTLRSLIRVAMNWDSEQQPGVAAGSSLYFERAFVQFAGFTAGYTTSFFNTGTGITYFMGTPYAGDNLWNTVLAYTAEFGGGLSASLAVEDAANRTTGIQAAAATSAYTAGGDLISTASGMAYTNYQSGQRLPDLVANVRLDQSWGTAFLSGALHQVGAVTPMGMPGAIYPGLSTNEMLGWAIGAILELKTPFTGPADSIYMQAGYADGAINYLGLSGTPQVHASGLGNISVGPNLLTSSGAFYPIADAVWNQDTLSYSTESGWALSAIYRHYWTPSIRNSLYVGYVAVNMPQNTVGAYDVNVAQVGLDTIWSPVRDLDIGLEVIYSRVDGEVPLANRPATNSAGALTYATTGGSTDVWAGGLRVQRNF